MKVKQQNGLTLIEVLIVVALLMLVLVAAFKVFGVDINRTKDADRKSDLRDIKVAFEDYYNDNQTYPPEDFLNDCNGTSLKPYLRTVPCDPVTGDPYLYMPYPGNGDNSLGYRILSILNDKSDPVIEKLGCQNGCGIPSDNSEFANSSNYVYGISEGVPLVLDGDSINVPVPTVDPLYCDTHLCYCCANSAYTSDQDCNSWVEGNNCDMGPYTNISDCYTDTPCVFQ